MGRVWAEEAGLVLSSVTSTGRQETLARLSVGSRLLFVGRYRQNSRRVPDFLNFCKDVDPGLPILKTSKASVHGNQFRDSVWLEGTLTMRSHRDQFPSFEPFVDSTKTVKQIRFFCMMVDPVFGYNARHSVRAGLDLVDPE